MNVALSVLGLVGGACFAFAAVPTALIAARKKRNPGVPVSIAWSVFVGTLLVYSYLVLKFFTVSGIDWILTFNYGVEAVSWGTILLYTYRPVKDLPPDYYP